jgi:hypothetical protein
MFISPMISIGSLQQSTCGEADAFSANQEIRHDFLLHWEFHYRERLMIVKTIIS